MISHDSVSQSLSLGGNDDFCRVVTKGVRRALVRLSVTQAIREKVSLLKIQLIAK